MNKLVKIILLLLAGIVGLGVIGAIALFLFFDPNDFRDKISTQVAKATGRELVIEGDLSISVFPWLAVEIGRTTLGNAEGFGDEPFISFDEARLSVQLVPLIFRREISVGTASLDGFEANLAVARNGVTNWDDLLAAGAAEAEAEDEAPAEAAEVALDIANVRLNDARITYADAQSGSTYTITGLSVGTGRIAAGQPFDLDAGFRFTADPGDLGGTLSLKAAITLAESMQQISVAGLTLSGDITGLVSQPTVFKMASRAIELDTAAERVAPGEIDLEIFGLQMAANVEPFAYGGSPRINADLRVADFSLKDLMRTLDIEAPVTADPNALGKLSFDAKAALGEDALALSAMTLVMDDTTMKGDLSVPLTEAGSLQFELHADSITLDNYMAPADESAGGGEAEASDVEIPVELIRALKARGNLRLDEAFLGAIAFTNMQLGVNAADGKLRLHPITAEFFEGNYQGDVRVDASGATPSLAVNERINDVNLGAMARSLFEAENITGTINGSFVLGGNGATVSAIRSDLDGTMSFTLEDGAWEGTDVWHQLRSARALYKREAPPEPRLPPRTEFTSVKISGQVTDGVFANDDLLAEMPFLRVTGGGIVDLNKSEVDYSVQARVLDRPELLSGASADELSDFTEALIPIRISGPLASPSFRPDIEAMFRAEVEKAVEEKTEELKGELFKRLLGGDEKAEPDAAGEGADTEKEAEPEPESVEDQLKEKLKGLFPR